METVSGSFPMGCGHGASGVLQVAEVSVADGYDDAGGSLHVRVETPSSRCVAEDVDGEGQPRSRPRWCAGRRRGGRLRCRRFRSESGILPASRRSSTSAVAVSIPGLAGKVRVDCGDVRRDFSQLRQGPRAFESARPRSTRWVSGLRRRRIFAASRPIPLVAPVIMTVRVASVMGQFSFRASASQASKGSPKDFGRPNDSNRGLHHRVNPES